MNIIKKIGLSLAFSALAFSVTAQAATRSASAIPAAATVQKIELARVSAPAASENELEGESGILLAILAAAALLAALVISTGGNDSPG